MYYGLKVSEVDQNKSMIQGCTTLNTIYKSAELQNAEIDLPLSISCPPFITKLPLPCLLTCSQTGETKLNLPPNILATS